MVERPAIRRTVHLEFAFDRLRAIKLEQAYGILVPDRVRIIGRTKVTGGGDEDRSDLRSRIVGQAKGGEHDCQPDSGTGCIRARAPVRGAAGVGVRGRRP